MEKGNWRACMHSSLSTSDWMPCDQLPQDPASVIFIPQQIIAWYGESQQSFSLKLLLVGCFVTLTEKEEAKTIEIYFLRVTSNIYFSICMHSFLNWSPKLFQLPIRLLFKVWVTEILVLPRIRVFLFLDVLFFWLSPCTVAKQMWIVVISR